MKTINELNEITSLDSNTYVPVSKEGGGETIKYNLSSLDTKITDVSNSVGNLTENFNTQKKYYPGQFVLYQDKMYKFIQIHPAGEWNPNDVEETSIFQEFQGLDEKVIITISGLPDVENKTIVVYVEGEPSPRNLTTNFLGQAQTMITKGLTYKVYPQSYGSYVVQNYLDVKAALNQRYINIPYLLGGQSETCTVEVNITTSGVGGNIADFTGLGLTILNQSNQSILTSTIDSNGKATFYNVTKYTNYTINSTSVTPKGTSTYRKPANSTILTNFDPTIVNIDYKRTDHGIFLVNSTTWEETQITADFINTLTTDKKSTYPYIHVCTEALANTGCDYYVRCRDLTSERLATESANKQWATSNVSTPNVSYNTNEYNGRKQTYYMLYDSIDLGISSPAALLVYNQTIEINNNIAYGFLGTRPQMSIIYENTGNRGLIKDALASNRLGYSSINFDTTNTWSSTQYQSSSGYAWFWNSGGSWKYNNATTYAKNKSYLVVPFFTFL
jgi:hypothetical protein